MYNSKTVTDGMLEDAYRIIARIVRDQGELYLPIFKRLHEERQLRHANKDLASVAKAIADNMKIT